MTEHYRYIFSFVLSRVHNFCDAEDIVQETYLTAVLKHDSLTDVSKSRAWLTGIASNKIRQYFRRKSVDCARLISLDDSPDAASEDSLYPDENGELKKLSDALMSLKETWRQCAVVNILCGFSGEECAEILGVPPQTVYNRTHKAKKALRELLGGTMEISMEKFDLMLKEGVTETERVLEHLRDLTGLITCGEHEKAASAIMSASVLASDSAEAHKQILQEVIFALRLMRLPKEHIVSRKLTLFGEQEVRLIEKLGISGVLQFDTGTAFGEYEFYNDFADFFSVTGQFSRAHEYCEKAIAAGETSKMRLAGILDDEGRYEEAAAVFMEIAENSSDRDRAMAYNRISNCMRKLSRHEECREYQLKTIELIRTGAVYDVG
ncbi:MAG: sigma-70 family RNA polymerase sigma factor, partial [Clostridia bacterium]|nr:sigma-70 family RNA polymerase sigma factor [Clostridia bacterium]